MPPDEPPPPAPHPDVDLPTRAHTPEDLPGHPLDADDVQALIPKELG